MNFGELKDLFFSYTNVSTSDVDDADISGWFNEAVQDLAYDFGPIVEYTYENIEKGEKVALPPNALSLWGDNEHYERDITGRLSFLDPTNTTIYYLKIPSVYIMSGGVTVLTTHGFTGTDETETSELHEALHYLLVLFACSRYWDAESEGDGEETALATKWMAAYLQGKRQAVSRLAAARNTASIDKWIVIE